MTSRSDVLKLLRACLRLTWHFADSDDAWDCLEHDVSHRMFGQGSLRAFSWYFEGESTVAAPSFGAIPDFLLRCAYVRDDSLFRHPDVWQHPLTFEQIRKGDCEDHALWAWRKLKELGHPAHLMIGDTGVGLGEIHAHAWVVFEGRGGLYHFETTAKRREGMVRPLDEVRALYRPALSVDHDHAVYVYAGLLDYLEKWLRRRDARASTPPSPDAERPSRHCLTGGASSSNLSFERGPASAYARAPSAAASSSATRKRACTG